MQDIYRIQYRQPVKSDLMYRLKFGEGTNAVYRNTGCQTASGDTHPDYAGWCGSEAELEQGARQYLASTKPAKLHHRKLPAQQRTIQPSLRTRSSTLIPAIHSEASSHPT